MHINALVSDPVNIEGEPAEDVIDFTYLGSVISTDNGAQKHIKARIIKARGVFSRIRTIWKSKHLSLKTKIKLYNSNVKSVLLYGSECWRVVKEDMSKIDAFHNSCLRKICNIYWPNTNLYIKTRSNTISLEIKIRRLRWLGHVFRMPCERIPKVELRWTPPGKRKRGRPRITWRRTVETELEEMGLSWGGAQYKAQDRPRWRELVAALCPTWDEED